MPKRKVVQTVIVFRDGQRIKPAIGEIFDFTQKELESINKMNPGALDRPVIEVDAEAPVAEEKTEAPVAEEKTEAPVAEEKTEAKATTKKGGKAAQDEEV